MLTKIVIRIGMKKFLLYLVLTSLISTPCFAKRFNLQFEPIDLLIGVATVQIELDINENLTITPYLSRGGFSLDGFEFNTQNYGLKLNYYFSNSTTDGWYTALGYEHLDADLSATSLIYGSLTNSANYSVQYLVAGYRWVWETFNLTFGAGPAKSDSGIIELKDSSDVTRDTYEPDAPFAIELVAGWYF